MTASPPKGISETNNVLMRNDSFHSASKVVYDFGSQENQTEVPPVSGLTKRLGISLSLSNPELQVMDESEDTEFLELALGVIGERASSYGKDLNIEAAQALREHWRKSNPRSIPLKELNPLLRDYQRLIARHHM
ncbi:hypothetical protein RJ639_033326 [Escallonia herrerae]|uniref:Uncharacterized protein n=1 Tax=Escallonia herrerae TaxID=1293975 RepID=A0AA89BAE8_9ASTE|nr:hypothetical protein RJ639_033326 [Escallonia herrerae]